MISESQLDVKIEFWKDEYGWGGMPSMRTGANLIHTLIDHEGFVPSSGGRRNTLNTIGDEVEEAVKIMEQTPGMPGEENVCFKAAMALRALHLTPKHWPDSERILRLRLIGLPMGRNTFLKFVGIARGFLMGYLTARQQREEGACV